MRCHSRYPIPRLHRRRITSQEPGQVQVASVKDSDDEESSHDSLSGKPDKGCPRAIRMQVCRDVCNVMHLAEDILALHDVWDLPTTFSETPSET